MKNPTVYLKFIETGWQACLQDCYPNGAEPEQERQLRGMFYAGVAFLWKMKAGLIEITNGDTGRLVVVPDGQFLHEIIERELQEESEAWPQEFDA